MTKNLMIPEASSSEQEDEYLARPIEECLTPKLRESLDEIPNEIREMTTKELEAEISPSPVLRRIRINFWAQYHRTIVQALPKIEVQAVVNGVCSREYFYNHVMKKPAQLAWLFHPPTDFDTAAIEALDFGIERLRDEILTAPLYAMKEDGSRGAFQRENAAIVLNAVKFLDARVKGSPLQRIEQKSLHVHKQMPATKGITKEDLDRELLELREKLNGGAPPIIDVPEETE